MVTSYGDISKDVLIEILSRLPIKSLLRFKSCCKLVHILVKDPNFISLHIKNYNDCNTRLIVSYLKEEDLDEIHVPLLYLDEALSDISHRRLYPEVLKMEKILGCQDGLIFLFNCQDLRILNLATTESITLSIFRSKLPANLSAFTFDVGFGLDPISKQRKLAIISGLFDHESDSEPNPLISHVVTYNLDTNSWRELGDSSLINYRTGSHHTYLNGFCYWIMYQEGGSKVICSFDLSSEMFNKIDWPYDIPKSKYLNIGLHNEFLSLIIWESYQKIFDIWAVNEGLWTKQLTIDLGLPVSGFIGFCKNGMCFMPQDCWGLLFYDASSKELRNLGLDDYYIDICTFEYKESVLALHKGD